MRREISLKDKERIEQLEEQLRVANMLIKQLEDQIRASKSKEEEEPSDKPWKGRWGRGARGSVW